MTTDNDKVSAALEVMDTRWGGYGNAKATIRAHIDSLTAEVGRLRNEREKLDARIKESWQRWPEDRRAFCALMVDLSLRLTSGNSVPVERTHLTAAEFDVIERHALACEDIGWVQYDAITNAEANARRYLFLRDGESAIFGVEGIDGYLDGEALDAAVDAAITAREA